MESLGIINQERPKSPVGSGQQVLFRFGDPWRQAPFWCLECLQGVDEGNEQYKGPWVECSSLGCFLARVEEVRAPL